MHTEFEAYPPHVQTSNLSGPLLFTLSLLFLSYASIYSPQLQYYKYEEHVKFNPSVENLKFEMYEYKNMTKNGCWKLQ